MSRPTPFPEPVEASPVAFTALCLGLLGGTVVAVSSVVEVATPLAVAALVGVALSVVLISVEAHRVSRRAGVGPFKALARAVRAGGRFLVFLL